MTHREKEELVFKVVCLLAKAEGRNWNTVHPRTQIRLMATAREIVKLVAA